MHFVIKLELTLQNIVLEAGYCQSFCNLITSPQLLSPGCQPTLNFTDSLEKMYTTKITKVTKLGKLLDFNGQITGSPQLTAGMKV